MAASTIRNALEQVGLLAPGASLRADLHVHSTMSDGSCSFAEIIGQARRSGLTHIAFANHDTTCGLSEAARLGEEAGVCVIGGIEVSAYDRERRRKVHVLGLCLEEDAPALRSLCSPTLAARDANTRWQLDRIERAGYDVDLGTFDCLAAASTCAYKQHIMASLTDDPYGSSAYRALYRALFKGGGIADRDIDYVDARDAVRAIVSDGGLAVLAHPGQLDSWDLIPELVACGLTGIEKHHHDHTSADEVRAQEAAERFGLFCTGGSDFHGAFGKAECVGERLIEG